MIHEKWSLHLISPVWNVYRRIFIAVGSVKSRANQSCYLWATKMKQNHRMLKPHSLFILSNLRQIHCPSRIWSSFKVILGKKVRRKKYCPVWLLMGYLILFAYLVGNGNPNHKKAHGNLLFAWNAVNKARKKGGRNHDDREKEFHGKYLHSIWCVSIFIRPNA